MEPSTWAKVKVFNDNTETSIVEYCDNSPVWYGNSWDNGHLKFFNTEKEAREIVENYEKNKDYDKR